ncbi:MAG: carbohydrate porin [Bryobacteraceae bacterium]|nr:carbohydrate porin [Bryobacteraceae bacterium]
MISRVNTVLFACVLSGVFGPKLGAQAAPPDSPPTVADSGPDSDLTWNNRIWLSGQANFITQYHPSFSAKYSGTNSFSTGAQDASSRVLTLFAGFRLFSNTEVLFDLEESGGHGLSEALGLAGFTNLDVVRNPTLGKAPYVARLMLHQTIPLSKKLVAATPGPLALASSVPERRVELRFGKLSTDDFFDVNGVGSDSHSQFMNWTADTNGAYDYAADTRGYTYGLLAEYYDRGWAFRFGEMLMPTVANGIKLDWSLPRAHSENYEFELRPSLFRERVTTLRLLSYVNHANMGNYREAIQGYLDGVDPVPDVIAYRRQGRVKYGFGINAEQELTADWRAYARFGWNEGHNESFAYTEVDQSASFGTDLRGVRWRRKDDKVGVAFLLNAISGDHRQYLALGGLGFLLGDGALNYGRERIVETYYNVHTWRSLSMGADLQRVWNPGYNRDRGPVWVAGFRLHVEGSLAFWQHDTP